MNAVGYALERIHVYSFPSNTTCQRADARGIKTSRQRARLQPSVDGIKSLFEDRYYTKKVKKMQKVIG
jgi:hypothetical protein